MFFQKCKLLNSQEVKQTMASNNSNIKAVPEAMNALEKFKYEVASDEAVKNIFKSVVKALPITNDLCKSNIYEICFHYS